MASDREDNLSILVNDDLAESLGREAPLPDRDLQAALRTLLRGTLSAEIRTVIRQQAALVMGEMADSRDPTPGPSGGQSSRTELRVAEQAGGTSRQAILIGGEIVSRFNPDSPDTNVDWWLSKIDQHGEVHGWSDYDRATIMQSKLTGAARKWYHRQEEYNLTWVQWKAKLKTAFPKRYNFAVLLEELVARRKSTGESMTSYFHAKLELCSRVGVKGEKAVSCIIRGLPEELRANAYATGCETPEVLYNQFLAGLDEYRARATARGAISAGRSGEHSRAPKRRLGNQGDLIRCYNCQALGTHRSRDCPERRMERCWSCGDSGHQSRDCPKATTSREAVSLLIKPTDSIYRQIGYVNGRAVRVYIDTGSAENIMGIGTAQRLGLPVDDSIGDVILSGFGGGVASALGRVQFELAVTDTDLDTSALVTDADMGRIELLLGQMAINSPGVTLIVRNNMAVLTTQEDVGELLKCMVVDAEPSRCRLVLSEDLTCRPRASVWVEIDVQGGLPGTMVYSGAKKFQVGTTPVVVGGVYQCDKKAKIMVTNLGHEELRWTKGRLVSRAEPCRSEEKQATEYQVNTFHVTRRPLNLADVTVGDVTDDCKRRLFKLLLNKANCFSAGDDDVGLTPLGAMEIKLTTDVPVYYRPYRLSFSERRLVREKVQTLKQAGVIRDSNSAYASPIVLIPKKTGDVRLCVDYRALNAITVKDRYPLPLIADQLDRLAGRRYFTTLDLAQGYHQVPMHPNSVDKTAFVTPDGQYEYLRVPFGLANSPAVFQRIINLMLGNLRHDQVLAYMDDLMIPTQSAEQGLQLLETVLQLVEKARLKLNLRKCSFLMDRVEYLGHEIDSDGVRPGEKKIKAVINFPTPTDVHGVRQFIGLTSYFRKFVKGFSVIARPLTDLTKKAVSWTWGDQQQQAFDKLKGCLATRPVLAIYDSQAETQVHTDACKLGIGGILMQQGDIGGAWRPVAYFSRSAAASEQLYHSYELETLAVVETIRRFRVYLLGIHFRMVTDCTAVRATLLKRDLVPRIARWWLTIQEYDMEVEYRPGGRMQHVDALSRNPVEGDVGVNLISLAENDWFLTVQLQDPKAQDLVSALTSGTASGDVSNNFKVKSGRLYRVTVEGDRLYVPAMARFNVVHKHHDEIGHPGCERCLALVKETYWFPKMRRFIFKYVKSCLRCTFAKGDYGRAEGKLHPIERRPVPFDTVHVDHLGPFTRSVKGNTYLLMVDGFTKFVLAKLTRTLRSTEAIARLREIFGEFGYPRRVISDRGLAFTSRAFRAFMTEKGIKHVLNAIATPRANGQGERPNRTIVEALAASADSESRWDEKLSEIIWGMNHTINASTRFSPSQLMFSHDHGAVAGLANGGLASTSGADGFLHDEGVAVNDNGVINDTGEAGEGGSSDDDPVDTNPLEKQPTVCEKTESMTGVASSDNGVIVDTDKASVKECSGSNDSPLMRRLAANRGMASDRIRRAAQRMKVAFDKRRKPATKYKTGDLILWRQACTTRPGDGANRKLCNKFDGPFRIAKALGNDRYLIEAIKGVRGYKRFQATVAVDSIRRYVNEIECDTEVDESEGESDS